jgi:hypothetical protein
MGQGGYGADQAFLWYERDAAAIEHHLHIFAFITTDFRRMQNTRFLGYPKPALAIESGALAVRGVPVPERAAWAPWLTRYLPAIRNLRSATLVERLRSGRVAPATVPGAADPDPDAWAVVEAMFDRLQALNRERHSQLVLAYLPVDRDYSSGLADGWRERVRAFGLRAGVPVIDLVDAMRRLPAAEIPSLFIQDTDLAYAGAAGHYTEDGNRWVAETLLARLAELRAAPPGARPRP